MDSNQPLLLRPAEVARLLSISRSRCYELLAGGLLPAVRIGQSIRVPRADLERWIEEHKEAAQAGERGTAAKVGRL